jgi:hypothetical protein
LVLDHYSGALVLLGQAHQHGGVREDTNVNGAVLEVFVLPR